MGTLKPGAKYIYEREDGVVYAREVGAPDSERIEIGWDFEAEDTPTSECPDTPTPAKGSLLESIRENKLWGEIRRMAETNPAMREELERVKTFYYLLKQKEPIDWHPV